ncbi:secreted protein [Legionella santicrucis]|uniref:Secreted protein n=1 Tax=Legionella santicrucis TaxID=45074 RepID=A0A0W0YFK0_9GAMM|nr:hypothetical protein [Legionella santicrucis]KTD55591.1 secreted protein [Legionella santicrucis]
MIRYLLGGLLLLELGLTNASQLTNNASHSKERHIGTPLWTFTPNLNYPPKQKISAADSITVQYTVTNQSSKSHSLQMKPIPGVTVTGCSTLPGHQSCLLTLTITGSALTKNITDGPILCEQGNPLQCYRPSPGNELNIKLTELFAYVSSFNSGRADAASVYKCDLTSTAGFENCILATNTSGDFENIAFATVRGTQYAYVANNGPFPNVGNMYYCTLNTDGSFNSCIETPTSGAPSWNPVGIAFATVQGVQYAYVTSGSYGLPGNKNVFQCTLNTNGTFNTCIETPATGAPSWNPLGIAFATVQGIQYAYVADFNGSMYRCTLNTDGTLNGCTVTPTVGAPSWLPDGVSFTSVQGIQYAYVADYNRNVYRCTLNTNGTFNTCSVTPIAGAPIWLPEQIAFLSYNGAQYAYVADNILLPNLGNMYQCTIEADGSFNACTATPITGAPNWSPAGIAFN